MLRTAVAVVIAYLLFAALSAGLFTMSGLNPHEIVPGSFLVGSTIYGICAAAATGYVAVAIARRPDLRAAAALSALIVLSALVSMATSPRSSSHWSQLMVIVLMAPAAYVGGALRLRHRRISVRKRRGV